MHSAWSFESLVDETIYIIGPALAIWSFGSALAATVTGAMKFKASPATRFVATLLGLTALSAMLIFATTMWQLTIALFVSGFAIAPLLVSGFSVVEQEVPDSQITEGIAVVSMGFSRHSSFRGSS